MRCGAIELMRVCLCKSTSDWRIRLFVLFKSSLQSPYFISSKFDQFLCKPQLFCKKFKLGYFKIFVKYLDDWSHFKGTMNLFLIIKKKNYNYNILKHFKLEMCMLNEKWFFPFWRTQMKYGWRREIFQNEDLELDLRFERLFLQYSHMIIPMWKRQLGLSAAMPSPLPGLF